MSAPFHLVLDHDGIALSREGEPDALLRVALDAPDFDARIGEMRDLVGAALATDDSEALGEDGGLPVTLVLPDSQILYTETPASGLDEVADAVRVQNALVGATPYELDELVWDWGVDDRVLKIAVVARETIAEATAFAEGHGFAPSGYVGAAVGVGFLGAPRFDLTSNDRGANDRAALAGQASEEAHSSVETPAQVETNAPSEDDSAVAADPGPETSSETEHASQAVEDAPSADPSAQADEPTPLSEPKRSGSDAPAPPTPEDASPLSDADTNEPAAPDGSIEPGEAPADQEEVVAAFTSLRAQAARSTDHAKTDAHDGAKEAPPAQVSALAVAETPGEKPLAASKGTATKPPAKAPIAAPNPAPLSATPARPTPAPVKQANLKTLAKATPDPETGLAPDLAPPQTPRPRKEIRRRLVGKVVPAPVGAAPSATSDMDESQSLTVFGARRTGAEQRGSGRLGIVLTVALLAVMGLVALWSLWLEREAEPEALALVRPEAATQDTGDTAPESGGGLSIQDANGTLEIETPAITPLPEGGPEAPPDAPAAETPVADPAPAAPAPETAGTPSPQAPPAAPPAETDTPEVTIAAAPTAPLPEVDQVDPIGQEPVTESTAPANAPAPEATPDEAPAESHAEPALPPEAVEPEAALSASVGVQVPVATDEPALVTAALTPPGGAEPAPLRLQDLRLPEAARRDAAPTTPEAPLPRGSFLGPDGLVVPLADGALAPGGYALFTGPPPILPPARPSGDEADTDADTQVEDTTAPDPLEDARPQPRPEDQGALSATEPEEETAEAADSDFAGIRPRGRPDGLEARAAELAAQAAQAEAVAREQAEAAAQALAEAEAEAVAEAAQIAEDTAGATRLAVAAALKPPSRPANMPRIVARAQQAAQPAAAPQQSETASAAQPRAPAAVQAASASAAAAPAPNAPIIRRSDRIRPSEPSSALVARQATQNNALRLNRVTLIGVYGSASQRRALVRLPSGRYVKVQVGDRLDGGRVTAMTRNSLQYTKSGRAVELEMPSG